jgi:GT2 family glycosyltransferase
MNKEKYSITFACYNAVDYTRKCIDSMIKTNTPLDRLVVIDNCSNDSTRSYLETLQLGGRIYNNKNLGCGVAWNQGALFMQSEWTIIMNNDVVVSPNWIESLITTAENIGVKIISPAIIEGELDYDFDKFLNESKKLSNVYRLGDKHAVCLAIHESVWDEIGYFSPVPKLLGYEDTIFFNNAIKSKIQMAMTGASWLHHFGSITQSLMKQERNLTIKDGLGNRYNYKILGENFINRKINKIIKKSQKKYWKNKEIENYGMSLHGIRKDQKFYWL